MLDHHGHGVARVLIGSEADEERVRAPFARQVLGPEAALPLLAGHALDLHATRLAGQDAIASGQSPGGAGAAFLVHHGVHALPHQAQVALGHAQGGPVLRLHAPDQLAADRVGQVGLHRPAGGEAGGHRGQGERGELIEALADAMHDGVAQVPGLALLQAPFAGGHEAAARARQLDLQVHPHAEALGHGGDAVDAGALGHLVEEDVAGEFERVAHVDRAMAVARPAVEARVAQVVVAGAEDPVLRRDHLGVQRRHAHHHLEGGARRVEAVRHLVDQRRGALAGPLLPLRGGDAGIEESGVEGGLARHGQDLARLRVEHDGAGAFLAAAAHATLELGIDADLDVLARHALAAVQLADHAADDVHLQALGPGTAAQDGVVVAFDPRAADADARQFQQRVVADVAFRRRSDVAHHMGELLVLRIVARGADIDADARQVRRVDLQQRHLVPGQEVADGDGDEAAAAADVALDAGLLVVLQGQQLREGLQHRRHVARRFRGQQGAPVQPVGGDDLAVAVHDAAARRRQEAGGDAVLLRQRGVAVALVHLQPVQAVAEEAQPAELDAAQHQGATGEDGAPPLLLAPAAHGCPPGCRMLMPGSPPAAWPRGCGSGWPPPPGRRRRRGRPAPGRPWGGRAAS
ncbi:hypothetical protein ROMU108268_02570 [Roseomonas mucosa]